MLAWLRPRLERDLDTLASAHAARGTLSGALLVAQRGRIVFRQAYGLANAELGVLNTPETVASARSPRRLPPSPWPG